MSINCLHCLKEDFTNRKAIIISCFIILNNFRHRQLTQSISDMFGGMDLIGIDILVAKDGREIVHDVNDVLNLLGDAQEEDRRAIADLVQTKIVHLYVTFSMPNFSQKKEVVKSYFKLYSN